MTADDRNLVIRAQGGDLDAFEELVRRFQAMVFGVAYHTLGNVEDARDVAQDVFVRAFTRLAQLRDPTSVGAWLRQIAVNECRVQRPRLFSPVCRDPADDPSERLNDRLLVEAALARLDNRSRLTITLYYLQSHSVADIAAFLDEPATTIKSRCGTRGPSSAENWRPHWNDP